MLRRGPSLDTIEHHQQDARHVSDLLRVFMPDSVFLFFDYSDCFGNGSSGTVMHDAVPPLTQKRCR